MKRFRCIHRFVLMLMLVLVSCVPASRPAPAETVRLQLRWLHQSQSAGFYAADQRGLYAGQSIQVEMLEGGPRVDLIESVVSGQAQFGIANPDQLIVARAQGQPVKAVAAIFRVSPAVFMVLADSGIRRPQDFTGKVVQVPPQLDVTLNAVLAKAGVPLDQVTRVNLGTDLSAFYTGEVQVWTCFVNAQPYRTRQEGYEVELIYPDDYGVHFYGNVLFTTDALIEENPGLVRRFVTASLEGWGWALENIEEASTLTLDYDPEADLAFEQQFLEASFPLIQTGQDPVGHMSPEAWQHMYETLHAEGLLPASIEVETVYTFAFMDGDR